MKANHSSQRRDQRSGKRDGGRKVNPGVVASWGRREDDSDFACASAKCLTAAVKLRSSQRQIVCFSWA